MDLRTKRAQLEKGCSTDHSVIGLPGDCSGSFECKFVEFECAAPSCLLAESTLVLGPHTLANSCVSFSGGNHWVRGFLGKVWQKDFLADANLLKTAILGTIW